MKVLLTGATGFLGRYVLKALWRRGIDTVVIGRHSPSPPVPFIAVDLLNDPEMNRWLSKVQASHLLHLAWYAEHGKYWTSSLNLRWLEATLRLVEGFCEAGGQRLVAAGTCAEYDWQHGYCREETTPLAPATLYGVAKDATRRLVLGLSEQAHVSCAWARIFFPYGPGEAAERLIPSLWAVFRGQRAPFGIHAEVYRDFIHAADVAEALLTLLTSDATGCFNVSSGQPTRLAELVREIARRCHADPQPVLELAPSRPGEPPLLVGENLKLKALGWHAHVTLAQGLDDYAQTMIP